MDSVKGQLTLRGIVIGCVGCAIITAASVYTALKMGALPWPIVFAAIISLFFLKALGHGKASLNEANVTHTVMSAGAMVAGGLAFTIPGIWMLGYADEVGWFEMLLVAVSGVIMGLVCTALLRRHFIEDSELEYPIGEAAAQTLIAGDSGGKTGWKLFGSMGFAGAFTALRDFFGVISAMLFGNAAVPALRSASTCRRCFWPWASSWARAPSSCGSSERCWRTSASSWAARPRDSGTWRPRRASCPASAWAS